MIKPANVDDYIIKHPEWSEAIQYLRSIFLDADLEETIKWMFPVFMLDRKNILSIGATKKYLGIWFFQGVFLTDDAQKLVNAQEGKTKAMRQWRFKNLEEIHQQTDLIQTYVLEAIENQKQGKELKPVRTPKPVILPHELIDYLHQNKPIQTAFKQLSNAQQREYAAYITTAKRLNTKIRRLEKIGTLILDGKGLNDKYKK